MYSRVAGHSVDCFWEGAGAWASAPEAETQQMEVMRIPIEIGLGMLRIITPILKSLNALFSSAEKIGDEACRNLMYRVIRFSGMEQLLF